MKKNRKNRDSFSLGLRRFVLEIKKNKKDFVTLFFSIFIVNLAYSSQKFLLGKTIDSFVEPEKLDWFFGWSSFNLWFLIFAMVLIFDAVFASYLWQYYNNKISFKIYKNYIASLFSKIVSFPTSFFKKTGMGKVIYSTTNGAYRMENTVSSLGNSFGAPLEMFLNMFFIFLISWKIFLLVLIGAIIYFSIFYLNRKKISALEDRYNQKRKSILDNVTEKVNLIFEVKKNNKEEKEKRFFKNKVLNLQDRAFYKKIRFDLFLELFRSQIYIILTLLSLWLSLKFYQSGEISLGEIFSINLYVMFLVWNFNWFVRSMSNFVKDLTVVGDSEKLLNEKIENYSKDKKKKEVEGEIKFQNVNFDYQIKKEKGEKKNFKLEDLNLKVDKGQKVAFVGESGGGKTTAIELIGGFYFPKKGKVLIDQIATKDWDLNSLRSSIAYVSQDIAIFNSTIGENIAYGALKKVSQKEIEKAAKLAHIDEFISTLPKTYKTKVGEKGLKLSGGQRQRIAIARAVLRDPKILILDEPTSALDIVSEKYITQSLKELMKGRTTIIIAHRLSTVADADKIFVFKNGKIVEEGNYQELVSKKGEFKKMVDLHAGLR